MEEIFLYCFLRKRNGRIDDSEPTNLRLRNFVRNRYGTEISGKKNTVIRQDSIHKHCTQDRPNNLSVAEQHIFLRKVKK